MSDTSIETPRQQTTVIKVKAENGTVGLAHVIVNHINSGKHVVLQAVGAGAVNQAVKGVASAGLILSRGGRTGLVCDIRMETGAPSPGFTEPVSVTVIALETKEML